MAVLHRPGVDPGPNAISALRSVVERGHPTRWLACDRAYSNARPENFQLPTRAIGYDLVLDYRTNQLGIQGSYAGALLMDGWWYCPSTPTALIESTIDERAGRITKPTRQKRIEARRDYRLRLKERPDADGHMRLMSPAAGTAPIVAVR